MVLPGEKFGKKNAVKDNVRFYFCYSFVFVFVVSLKLPLKFDHSQ